ncbi:MAG: hypothetical protein HRT47_05920 [Candidatus Caenarcaniphilales bacterium]|nr:hypothetical protein [Candidatus Caenarcaniphilales bacterium]
MNEIGDNFSRQDNGSIPQLPPQSFQKDITEATNDSTEIIPSQVRAMSTYNPNENIEDKFYSHKLEELPQNVKESIKTKLKELNINKVPEWFRVYSYYKEITGSKDSDIVPANQFYFSSPIFKDSDPEAYYLVQTNDGHDVDLVNKDSKNSKELESHSNISGVFTFSDGQKLEGQNRKHIGAFQDGSGIELKKSAIDDFLRKELIAPVFKSLVQTNTIKNSKLTHRNKNYSILTFQAETLQHLPVNVSVGYDRKNENEYILHDFTISDIPKGRRVYFSNDTFINYDGHFARERVDLLSSPIGQRFAEISDQVLQNELNKTFQQRISDKFYELRNLIN